MNTSEYMLKDEWFDSLTIAEQMEVLRYGYELKEEEVHQCKHLS